MADILQEFAKSFSRMAKLVSSIIVAYLLIISSEEILSREVPFTKCASPFGQLNSVDVTPCNGNPCIFKPGTTETVAVSFTPNEVVSNGKISLYAKTFFFWMKLPLKNPNICEGHGVKCPLQAGIPVEVSATQQVPQVVPLGTRQLKAKLVDQNGATVVCGIITVKIIRNGNAYADFE